MNARREHPLPPSHLVRPAALDGRHFSTLIIGGGINGVGVFRDLSLQGVDCLLVDKGDFSSGATSAPSRMIHGGLRYLEGGAFSMVAEATRERNRLLRNAPHLVRPLETLVPLSSRYGGLLSSMLRFTGLKAGSQPRGLFVVQLGLRLYDLLGRRQRQMPTHRIEQVSHDDAGLLRTSVRWTATYFDAWIRHPEWLVLELLEDAWRDQSQSVAANYCRLIRVEGRTAVLRDEVTGALARVTADTMVNATGAWLDQTSAALAGERDRIIGTKGSHLVLDHTELREALKGRMIYFEAADGRVCIVYPFLDRVLIGSTDIPVTDPDLVRTEPAEITYLLDALRELFPRLHFAQEQVVYTYVGVRPLGRAPADSPGRISRDHSVVVEPANETRRLPLISLVGGKWTTFRSLAEQAADEVLHQLGRARLRSTSDIAVGGGAGYPSDERILERLLSRVGAALRSPQRATTLVERYGSRAVALAERFAAAGDRPLRHHPGYSVAEVDYLCRDTAVVRLTDLVLRRSLLAIRGELHLALLEELADLAAAALGWDRLRRDAELDACRTVLQQHHHARFGPPGAQAGAPAGASLAPSTPPSIQPLAT